MTAATQVENIWCERGSDHSLCGFGIGFPHLHHDFAMSFLYPQVWKNAWKKLIKVFPRQISFKNISSVKFLSLFRDYFNPVMDVEKVFEPNHNGLVDRSKFEDGSVNNRVFTCFSLDGVDVKTSVAVNVASKISKIQFFVNHISTVYVTRELSTTVNDLASGIRKNMRKSELYGDIERRDEELSRLEIGQKSNRMPVLNSAAARLGQAMRETQDVLQRDNLEASASVINCIAGGNGDLPTQMSTTDLDDVFAVLQGNDAEYITNMIGAEDKIGTSAVGDAYAVMSHTRMIRSYYALPEFTRKFRYPDVSSTLTSELGAVNNMRVFTSSKGSVTANASLLGNDVANNFVAAKEGYKVVWQAGGKAKFIYLPPGTNNDPVMLRSTAGVNFYQGQCITNDLWVQNLRATGLSAV